MPASNTSPVSQPSSRAYAISRRELDGHTTVVAAAGELDLSSAPELKWALADALSKNASQVVVDLSNVTFVDSTTLGVLVGVQRRLNGTHLAIVCADEDVLGIFKLSGLLAMFELFPTLELALRSVRGNTTKPGLAASGAQRPPRPTSRDCAPLRRVLAPLARDADAGMVLALAATAMPFAPSVDAEAERWLRLLRLYGDAGIALQGLGVSEAPLEALGKHDVGEPTNAARTHSRSVVATVAEHAILAAERRSVDTIGTCDLFVAVVEVYGAAFERVLWAHGTDSDEVLERLGVTMPHGVFGG